MCQAYSELLSVLLNQKVCKLLPIVLISGVVVGHEVVVEVVVAPHPNEEDAVRDRVGHRISTEGVSDLIEGRLEVLDLLVEWYAPNLHQWMYQCVMHKLLCYHVDVIVNFGSKYYKISAGDIKYSGSGRGIVDSMERGIAGGLGVGWNQW